MTGTTIVDFGQRVREHAAIRPDQAAFHTFAGGDLEQPRSMTYGELDRAARGLAVAIRRHAGVGERVLLVFPSGLDFITGFLGCLYAGTVAVPTPVPAGQRQQVSRLAGIAADADASAVLTQPDMGPTVADAVRTGTLPAMPCLSTGEPFLSESDGWIPPQVTADSIAFLQYTSGSTSVPKGVRVTHGNLIHNEEQIRRAFRVDERSRTGGWLPLFHDMGLIGQVLGVLFTGGTGHLIAPMDFLKAPHRWLQMISRFRLEVSGGPNFAYDLCTRRIPEEILATLDLSGWRVAFNGSEPVRAATMSAFSRRFAAAGFDPAAFFPCYGLAESTLFVSGGPAGSGARVLTASRQRLERGTVAAPATDADRMELVCSGRHDRTQIDIAIVDTGSGRRLPPGGVGEIWIRGPSVTPGYWRAERGGGADVFDAAVDGTTGYLRTGDLGALVDEHLIVTGRSKETMVIRGRNVYPHDIEDQLQAVHPAIHGRLGAAFSVDTGEERLVIVHEARPGAMAADGPAAIVRAIRAGLAGSLQIRADAVVLVRPGAVVRTTSGKVRRTSMRASFLAGQLDALHEDIHPAIAALRGDGSK